MAIGGGKQIVPICQQSVELYSAEVLLGILLIQQTDMCEWEVTSFAITLPFPLTTHINLRNLYQLTDLQSQGCLVVGIRDSLLDNPGINGPILEVRERSVDAGLGIGPRLRPTQWLWVGTLLVTSNQSRY